MTRPVLTRPRTAWTTVLLALVLLSATGGGSATAQSDRLAPTITDRGNAPQVVLPAIDGNGDDLISFASLVGATGCAVDRVDSRDDVAVDDPKVIVCAPKEDTDGNGTQDYFVNGFDLRRFVLVYDRPARTLYVLWRMQGAVGDIDGNLNPDNNLCPPNIPTFVDQPGIGSQENYQARIDTNCDGSSDIIVSVGGVAGADQVTIVGATAGTSALAYRAGAGDGRDLELRLEDIDLPPVFRVFANANASFDGLGEDIVAPVACGTPAPSIDLAKSASVPVLCAGATVDFTLVVTNTGNVDLGGVTVVDALPAGLVFQSVGANTCGGPVGVAAGTVTVGPFGLASGASCTIVIRATRTAACADAQVNVATVEGAFQSPCFGGGQPIVITDQASATVLCGNAVCAITAADTSVCPDETVTICGPEGNLDYLWSTGARTRCIAVSPGTYSLTVTDRATGCASTNPCSITITPEDCRPCLGVLIMDEDTIDNDIHSIEDAAGDCGMTPDRLVNDDRPREVGNLPLRWNSVCPGGTAVIPSGQLFDEGVFALPATLPWTLEAFVAGTVPQDRLDKIANVQPLRTPELKQLEGKSFVAVVYDSDISMNYDPTNGNLQGARYGLFFFTVLDVIPPGSIPESGSSSSQWDLVVRVDPVPADYCLQSPFAAARIDAKTYQTSEVPGSETGAAQLATPRPNPFAGSTSFAYEIGRPDGAQVDITVYDVAGRRVRGLVTGVQAAGTHRAAWDGRDESGAQARPGIYFIRTTIGGEAQPAKRVMLVR